MSEDNLQNIFGFKKENTNIWKENTIKLSNYRKNIILILLKILEKLSIISKTLRKVIQNKYKLTTKW